MNDPAAAIAAALIAPQEGFRSAVYHGAEDPPDVWTIGIGMTFLPDGSKVTQNTPPMSYATAIAWLETLASHTCAAVRAMIKVPVTNHQVGALASFSYEEGLGALMRSTLLRDINSGNFVGAEGQFTLWDVADGHVVEAILNRRKAELAAFMTPDDGVAPLAPVPQMTADELNAAELGGTLPV
jgi:lysozyme